MASYCLKPWSRKGRTITAETDLDAVLGAVSRLPLKYWAERMFFVGGKDKELLLLTGGAFPAGPTPSGTHPVFSLKALPEGLGFSVCPCSSKRPFRGKEFRFIQKGCRMSYTFHVMDRTSYLIEAVRFNIPASVASNCIFKGQVPEKCIRRVTRGAG